MERLKFALTNQNKIPSSIVQKEKVVTYLETELTAMGLNQKEITDFITFWGPGMEQYESVAIQFFIDEVYADKIATIKVAPTPNSSKRIYMIYTPITKENRGQFVDVETKYEPFTRSGFTLIEWGGTEIEQVNLMEVAKVRRKKRGEQTCGLVQSSTMDVKRRNN